MLELTIVPAILVAFAAGAVACIVEKYIADMEPVTVPKNGVTA